MGSDSDLQTMQAAADILKEFGIAFELTVVSAHRTPERMFSYASSAQKRGLKVIIAGAGGAATNLLESTDLMGYGWPDLGDPVLSQCDVDALAFVFAWAIEGTAPRPPGSGPYVCGR